MFWSSFTGRMKPSALGRSRGVAICCAGCAKHKGRRRSGPPDLKCDTQNFSTMAHKTLLRHWAEDCAHSRVVPEEVFSARDWDRRQLPNTIDPQPIAQS